MIEGLSFIVAEIIIGKLIETGFKTSLFHSQKTYQNRLQRVIEAAVDEFAKEHPVPDVPGKFPFYQSQTLLVKMLEFSFFDAVSNSELEGAISQNKNIIPPQPQQLKIFLKIFSQKLQSQPDLKKYETKENYPQKIYEICSNTSEIVEYTRRTAEGIEKLSQGQTTLSDVPHYLTPIPKISKSDVVGRNAELSDLKTLFDKSDRILLLNGIGGIGKTTVAKLFVTQNEQHYHHICWIPITEAFPEACISIPSLLENFGLSGTTQQDRETLLRLILNQLRNLTGPNLLVLDNACDDLTEYRDLLPGQPQWSVLITSRQQFPGLEEYRLDTLTPDLAAELFTKYYTGAEESQVLQALLEDIGFHTLTIELLAKTLENSLELNTIAELRSYIKNNKMDADALKINVTVEHCMEYVQIYSHLVNAFTLARLDGEEIRLLQQFVLLPAVEISGSLFAELWQIKKSDRPNLSNNLSALVRKGWLEGKTKNSFRLHQVVAQVIFHCQKPHFDDCKVLVKTIIDRLTLDQTRDNPVDKFQWLEFGEVLVSIFDLDIPELAELGDNLGTIYREFGQYSRARDLLESALVSAKKNFGEDHPTVAVRQSNLALVYQNLGEYSRARDLLESALASDLKNFGEDHPTVAKRQSNLATVYRDLGEYSRARDLLELALASDLKNFGEDHPTVAVSQSNLATVYRDLGEYSRARDLLELALASDLKNFGEDHPTVAKRQSNLALVYKNLGEYSRARDLLELALVSNLKNFGEDHPTVATRQSNLAIVYSDLGEYSRARDLLETALASAKRNFGEDHPNVAIYQSNLARVFFGIGEREKARTLWQQAYSLLKSRLGEDHPHTKTVVEFLERF